MSLFRRKKDDKKGGKDKKDPARVTLAPPNNLEDELKSTLSQDVKDTPVFKDLPRLANRIVVVGSLSKGSGKDDARGSTAGGANSKAKVAEVISSFTVYYNTSNIDQPRANEWPKTYKIQRLQLVKTDHISLEFFDENEDKLASVPGYRVMMVEDSTRYFLMKDVSLLNPKETRNLGFAFYTREEAQTFSQLIQEDTKREIPTLRDMAEEPVVPADENDSDIQEPTHSEDGDKIIEEDQIDEVKKETDNLLREMGSAASNPDAFVRLRDSVNQRLSTLGTGQIRTREERRLSRIAIRNAIDTSGGSASTSTSTTTFAPPPNAPTKENKNIPIVIGVRRVVLEIAAQLEKPEDYKRIVAGISKPEYDSYDGDMEILIENWVTDIIGEKSLTTAVLKSCTQAIIHICTYQVKARLPTEILTGDVRGPEGWQIVVLFAHDVINVSHRRREKSLDAFGPQSEFWFEWMLNMCFDKNMQQLQSATLRISKLEFGPNIDPKKKDELTRLFCGGDLLVA